MNEKLKEALLEELNSSTQTIFGRISAIKVEIDNLYQDVLNHKDIQDMAKSVPLSEQAKACGMNSLEYTEWFRIIKLSAKFTGVINRSWLTRFKIIP